MCLPRVTLLAFSVVLLVEASKKYAIIDIPSWIPEAAPFCGAWNKPSGSAEHQEPAKIRHGWARVNELLVFANKQCHTPFSSLQNSTNGLNRSFRTSSCLALEEMELCWVNQCIKSLIWHIWRAQLATETQPLFFHSGQRSANLRLSLPAHLWLTPTLLGKGRS